MPSILERWRSFRASRNVYISISGDASTQVLNMEAKELYQTQDNLQAVVNFLSNSIAQLPLKVYTREGEAERRRDRDSIAAKLLYRPNEDQTEFEFIRALAIEYFVIGSVYVWVLPDANSESGLQLRIVPNEWIIKTENGGTYAPDTIRICTRHGGTAVDVPRSEFIQFRTYSAGNPGGFISPVAALRNTLGEQVEASRFRRQLWKSSGRLNAQIIRPKDVAPWTEEQKLKFATAFREAWGAGGSKAGSIPIMEDGMEIKPFATSFKEQQYAESVKLTREAVAAAYGVNPSLIWHSETQTYASAKDNARALYAECLGPVLQMLQQRINAFLLPMIGADSNTYVEFDLTEKLKGSFEDRAAIYQSACGAPYLTRDEVRSELNLSPLPNGEGAEVVTPLNVLIGGQASPQDSQPDAYDYPGIDNNAKKLEPCGCKECKEAEELRIKGKSYEDENEALAKVLDEFFKRQARSVIPKISADSENFWNAERWNKELAEDLEPQLVKIADRHGKEAAESLKWNYDTEITRAYLKKTAEKRAERINERTLQHITEDLEKEEPDTAKVFEVRENVSERLALSAAGAVASFAVSEAASQAVSGGAPRVVGRIVEKEWRTGPNARESHALMDGERVPIDADFSNGQHWPGEDVGDPSESCGCNCTTEVVITGG